MINDIMDLHTHTIASGHAYNTLYEMVHAAASRGLGLLGVTEHGPRIPGACHPFYFINFNGVYCVTRITTHCNAEFVSLYITFQI